MLCGLEWRRPYSARSERRPGDLYTLGLNPLLKFPPQLLVVANPAGLHLELDGPRRQQPSRFSCVPFNWMQPVATVRNVRDAEVFPDCEHIFNAARNERAHGDFEWETADIDIVLAP